MIEKRKPSGSLKDKALCKAMGHKWRHCRNPNVYECERCKGRWNKE